MGPRDDKVVPADLEVIVICLVLFGVLKGMHKYLFLTIEVELQ